MLAPRGKEGLISFFRQPITTRCNRLSMTLQHALPYNPGLIEPVSIHELS